MDDNRKNTQRRDKSLLDNTCSHCLYFESHTPTRRPLKGNCSRHKEWIESASFTTCSDMSRQTLHPKGIYRMVNKDNKWSYVRRVNKLRTQFFLVKTKGVDKG